MGCPHDLASPGMCPDCRRDMRSTPGEAPPVHRALEALIALAREVRPDWPETDARASLAHAAKVGMTWEQALVGLVRLMVDPEALPRDLVPPSTEPLAPRRLPPPEVAVRGARLARQQLIERARQGAPR